MVWGAARNKRAGTAGINPWFGVLPEINVWGTAGINPWFGVLPEIKVWGDCRN